MITTFCANPCIDRTVEIDRFNYGGMNRIQYAREDGSGKGINVALACATLGLKAQVTGVMPRVRSDVVEDRLRAMGCTYRFVPNDGAVRINTKVFDASQAVVTELNERGVPSDEAETAQAVALAAQCAQGSDYLVLTGSVPAGMPDDVYAQIIAQVRLAAPGCRIVLDAEGDLLARGLEAGPDVIKPNRYELELLTGQTLDDTAKVHRAVQDIIARYSIGLALVSLGAAGAYISDGQTALFAPGLHVEVGSTVGAGDCMVAGLLKGLSQNLPLNECFRLCVASATSAVMTAGTNLIDLQAYHDFIPQVVIQEVGE